MSFSEKIQALGTWSRGDQRAPHKPLLVLYALGRIQQGKARLVTFAEIESDLAPILRWALPRRTSQVSYPFWNLRNDGVWDVEGTDGLARRGGNKEPLLKLLRESTVVGGFPAPDDVWLRSHPAEIVHLARLLLESHFPPSLHDELCSMLGLSVEEPDGVTVTAKLKAARDPTFRGKVLLAYEYRCAVCGYDGRLDAVFVGLEAAHVRWHKAHGPDDVENGLALCSIHHKLFDVGAFSLSPDHRVLVADSFLGGQDAAHWMLRHHSQRLMGPRADKPRVAEVHRAWHWDQVFRKPERQSVPEVPLDGVAP